MVRNRCARCGCSMTGRTPNIQIPTTLRAGEAPAVFVSGADGQDQPVNYRLTGGYYVVDRLFDKASLVLGVGSDQQRVTLHQGDKPWYRAGSMFTGGFGDR